MADVYELTFKNYQLHFQDCLGSGNSKAIYALSSVLSFAGIDDHWQRRLTFYYQSFLEQMSEQNTEQEAESILYGRYRKFVKSLLNEHLSILMNTAKQMPASLDSPEGQVFLRDIDQAYVEHSMAALVWIYSNQLAPSIARRL